MFLIGYKRSQKEYEKMKIKDINQVCENVFLKLEDVMDEYNALFFSILIFIVVISAIGFAFWLFINLI